MARVMILEDQRPARGLLERYVGRIPALTLIGAFPSLSEGAGRVVAASPDILFLDLRLGGEDGFDVLPRLSRRTAIVVTTAHKERALEGFDHGVCDYLLKPFAFERFAEAVRRALAQLQRSEPAAPGGQSILLPVGKTRQRVALASVQRLEADGAFTKFVTDQLTLRVPGAISSWLADLPEGCFIRVHRRFAVNCARIDRVAAGELIVGDARVPVGRRFASSLKDIG